MRATLQLFKLALFIITSLSAPAPFTFRGCIIVIPQSFLLVLSQPPGLLYIEWRMEISASPSQAYVDLIIDLLRIRLVRYKIIKRNSSLIQ